MWDRLRYAGAGDRGGVARGSSRVAAHPARPRARACSSGTRTTRASSCGRAATSRSAGRPSWRSRSTSVAADSRPVHYEGVHWDPRHPQTTDVVSRMYAPAAEIEEFLAAHRDKPYVLCEYAHSMGNSFGAVHKYVDLAYREPLFQGGFIWDFADQALRRTDAAGREYFGYGGDFGDAPHDSRLQRQRHRLRRPHPQAAHPGGAVPLPGLPALGGQRQGHGREPAPRHLLLGARVRRDRRPGGPGAPGGGARDGGRPGGVGDLCAPRSPCRPRPASTPSTSSFRLRRTTRWASAGLRGGPRADGRGRPGLGLGAGPPGRRARGRPRHPQRGRAGPALHRPVLAAARRAGLVPLRADAGRRP